MSLGDSESDATARPDCDAEEIFGQYLSELADGRVEDFESVKARHPKWSPQLERLRELHQRLNRVLQSLAGSASERATATFILPDEAQARLAELLQLCNGTGSSRYAEPELIGSGGMGEIHRIWDRVLQRHVAMKVIRSEGASGAPGGFTPVSMRRVARFEREARLLGSLDHPGIVAIHDLGFDNTGRLFFTMPVISGRHFGDVLEESARRPEDWPLARLLEILLKVCDAVAYAHAQGIVHRDLKPANIMIGRFGETYVMDWGLAKVLERDGEQAPAGMGDQGPGQTPTSVSGLTVQGHAEGTPPYMSPEQATMTVELLGRKTDIYSLGAILYHILVGHPPHVPEGCSPSAEEVIERVRAGPPPFAGRAGQAASPELAAICHKAMERDPAMRYPTVSSMAADIRAFLEDRQGSVWRDSIPIAIGKWVRRHPVYTTSGAALAGGLLLTVAIVLLWQKSNDRFERVRQLEDTASARSLVARLEALARQRDLSPAVTPDGPSRHDDGSQGTAADGPRSVQEAAAISVSRKLIGAFADFGISFRDPRATAPAFDDRWADIADAQIRRMALDGVYELASELQRTGAAYAASFSSTDRPAWATDDDVLQWKTVSTSAPDLVATWPGVKTTIDRLDVEPWRQKSWRAALAFWFDRDDQFGTLIASAWDADLEASDLTRLYELSRDAGHPTDETRFLLGRAIEKNPGNFLAHFWLGGLERSERSAGLEQQRIAVALEPDSCAARYELAWVLQNVGTPTPADRQESIDNYRAAIRLDPAFTNAYVNLAMLLPPADGIWYLEAALRVAPPSDIVYLNLAVLFAAVAPTMREAADVARAGTLSFPQNGGLWFNLSLYLDQLGDTAGSIDALYGAIGAQPDQWQALVNLSLSLVNRAKGLPTDSTEAADLRQQAHEYAICANDARADDPACLYAIGCALYNVDEIDLAVAHLIQASTAGVPEALDALRTIRAELPAGPRFDETRRLMDDALSPPAKGHDRG